MKIQRYDVTLTGPSEHHEMEPEDEGEWVRYDDVAEPALALLLAIEGQPLATLAAVLPPDAWFVLAQAVSAMRAVRADVKP